MDWIIPANPNIYDVFSAFQHLEMIDWRQRANYKLGDIIYIYCSKPYQKIMFKCQVVKTDISDDIIDDTQFQLKENESLDSSKERRFARLKLLDTTDNELLHVNYLNQNGLKSRIQGPIKLIEPLKSYVEQYFVSAATIPEEITNELHEGAGTVINVNKYERNPLARKKCIEHFGCTCYICNMNFEEEYGEIGAGFIHVHHLTPLSAIKDSYVVNPIKDLIPVCPNCHAMIHRIDNFDKLSANELKNILNRNKA